MTIKDATLAEKILPTLAADQQEWFDACATEELQFHLFRVRWHSQTDPMQTKEGFANARLCREAALAFAEFANVGDGEIIVDRLPLPGHEVYATAGMFNVSDGYELEHGVLHQRESYDDYRGELSIDSYPLD